MLHLITNEYAAKVCFIPFCASDTVTGILNKVLCLQVFIKPIPERTHDVICLFQLDFLERMLKDARVYNNLFRLDFENLVGGR